MNENLQYISNISSFSGDSEKSLRVLFFADTDHPANVVLDHIFSFSSHSTHHFTIINPRVISAPNFNENDKFDAILVHYSIYILAETYFSKKWQNFLINFSGIKAIIHEDEYQNVNDFKFQLLRLGFSVVFSCLDSPLTLRQVYGDASLSDIMFYSCLPGYIPDNFKQFDYVPIADRSLDVVYRGRTLPPQLGAFAQEKRIIGEQMIANAKIYNLSVDISSEESDRIYGEAWPAFLTSGKCMLGVEGGASIFDFDGSLQKKVEGYCLNNPAADFHEIWANCLAQHEGNVLFKTITPKFFEAIAARTALILYPGKYNDILQPGRHYIVLEKDGSNIDEVVKKIRDSAFLQDMADRTYNEILSRDDLSARFYVGQVDRALIEAHLNLTMQSMKFSSVSFRQVVIAAQQELSVAQQELGLAHQELGVAQQELGVAHQELGVAQQELGVAQQELAATQQELISKQNNLELIQDQFQSLTHNFNKMALSSKELEGRLLSNVFLFKLVFKNIQKNIILLIRKLS